jgi:nicotinic acid mononucleotide adenylyltransferase
MTDFEKIESWYEADKLKELVKFIVFKRDNDIDTSKFNELKSKGYDFEFTTMDFEDISSTQIRGGEFTNLVTKEVEEYIEKNGLYKI